MVRLNAAVHLALKCSCARHAKQDLFIKNRKKGKIGKREKGKKGKIGKIGKRFLLTRIK
jgi:hypothetical protein